MDSHFPATKEDLHYVQMDVKHVQAVQNNHADRLLRLERRQADDAALRSVWGTGSPFPGVLSGTPIQGPVPNPSTDVFDDFDDEQNLLGSLHIETDEEPVRRGASRANSVRFDVSALQGSNWAQGSRNSGDFGPVRPSSGIGSHSMMERSLSHKSDGRQSSGGHSVHSMPSGRTSSLGLDTHFMIGGQHDEDEPLDVPKPPPGLFILGPVPSIIRCWLTTNFSHSALLYGAVCTGSQRSVLEYSLIKELGLVEQIQKRRNGRNTIRLPVYLPEAIITQQSSRSNSPSPQLPTLTSDFEIIGLNQGPNAEDKSRIRVIIGSDTLRVHNADILFSQNCMIIYGDDRNKLSVPFVRPEDENMFKNLCTSNLPPEKMELKATAASFTPTESKPKSEPTPTLVSPLLKGESDEDNKPQSLGPVQRPAKFASAEQPLSPLTASTVAAPLEPTNSEGPVDANAVPPEVNGNVSTSDPEKQPDSINHTKEAPESSTSTDPSRRESSTGVWSSWRQGTASNGSDNGNTSGYQKAEKARNMKVLKPSKSIAVASASSRSSSAVRTGAAYEPAPPSRPLGELRRKSQIGGAENAPLRWESKKVPAEEQKGPRTIATVPRSSNPIGGATAFSWMNSGKPKASATTAD